LKKYGKIIRKKIVREKKVRGKKQVREKSMRKKNYGEIVGKKSTGKKIWGKKYVKKSTGEKVRRKKNTEKYGKQVRGKSHVTSGDVISGQACARYHFRLLLIALPQIRLELCPYTTYI
jgi:hypothetical protein